MNNRYLILMLLLAIPALLIISCAKDEEESPANTPPTAVFTVDPESGNIQTEFMLDATACSDKETPANELLVRWDGNDDGIWETDFSTVKMAQVTFDNAGTYTIRLEVKDGGGLTASTTRQLTVGSNLPPEAPSDPGPADGSTEVGITAILQWASSDPEQDPLTFDVYFGTNEEPPLVSAGINANSYDQGTMEYSTTYYWKIVAHDNQGNSGIGLVWSFTTGSAAFSCGDFITDPRDGKIYPTLEIGAQCWMAKNLNIGERINGSVEMNNDGNIEKYCYDNNEANCDVYGGLYQWNEMLQYTSGEVQGICPDGWHIPSLQEWQELEISLGMPEAQATATSGWQGTDEGEQLKEGGSSGFNALMSGNRSTSGVFILGGLGTAFWTGTQASSFMATARSLDTDHSQVNHTNYDKKYGHAVRCVKD